MKFIHFHRHRSTFENAKQPVLPKGLATPCIGVRVLPNGDVYIAVAFTSPKDEYSKRLGRTIVTNRITTAIDEHNRVARYVHYVSAGYAYNMPPSQLWQLVYQAAVAALTSRDKAYAGLNRNERFWGEFCDKLDTALDQVAMTKTG